MRLLVVIVNYRTADLTIDCLDSLADEMTALAGQARVVVTDNASGDESVPRITQALNERNWDWVTFEPLAHNGGFSYGNNVPIRQDLVSEDPADFYLLLNPDTLVRPGAFTALLTFMAEHPDVGVAGSLLEFPDGSPQPTLHRAPTPWRALDDGARIGVLSRVLGNRCFPIIAENGTQPCEWVSGASMMVRRQVFEQVGLLDEGYFLYFDEVDFCMRVQQAGWKIFCVVESRVMHLEGVSTGIGEARKRRARYWYESRRRFLLKFYGIKGLIMADTLWFAGKMLSVVRRMGWPLGDPTHFVRDLIGGDLRALSNGEARSLAYGGEAAVEGTDVAERTRPEQSQANL